MSPPSSSHLTEGIAVNVIPSRSLFMDSPRDSNDLPLRKSEFVICCHVRHSLTESLHELDRGCHSKTDHSDEVVSSIPMPGLLGLSFNSHNIWATPGFSHRSINVDIVSPLAPGRHSMRDLVSINDDH
jgi:hypothetical protein